MFTGRPPHLPAFDYRGCYRYFLTFCTHGRRPLFMDAPRVDFVRLQILRTCESERFALFAYCFMPDHVHLLVEGQNADADCRRFIVRAKQLSGFYFAKNFGSRLWQRYGFERVLRREEQTLVVARYILDNPVRAGLVDHVEEYPFLGSAVSTVAAIMEAAGYDSRSG